MKLKALRRAHMLRESAGFLGLPAAYFALMLAGVLSYAPTLALLTMGLVFMLVMGQRSAMAAAAVAPAGRQAKGPKWSREELDAADRRFLRQVGLGAASDLGAFLILLLALDLHLRALAVGGSPGATLYVGAAVAVAVALFGRASVRRAAWRTFDVESPQLWGAKDGLNLGRTARSPASYLAWRGAAEPTD